MYTFLITLAAAARLQWAPPLPFGCSRVLLLTSLQDVKANNILLDEHLTIAKLGDVGLSRALLASGVTGGWVGISGEGHAVVLPLPCISCRHLEPRAAPPASGMAASAAPLSLPPPNHPLPPP